MHWFLILTTIKYKDLDDIQAFNHWLAQWWYSRFIFDCLHPRLTLTLWCFSQALKLFITMAGDGSEAAENTAWKYKALSWMPLWKSTCLKLIWWCRHTGTKVTSWKQKSASRQQKQIQRHNKQTLILLSESGWDLSLDHGSGLIPLLAAAHSDCRGTALNFLWSTSVLCEW